MDKTVFYPRHLTRLLIEALEDSPVVLIHGPRQCGKTTLAQTVCAPKSLEKNNKAINLQRLPTTKEVPEYEYINLDDDIVRELARTDPMGFVAGLSEHVILDEVHRVPEIFTALKMQVDRRRVPGRFLLTGSANVLLNPKLLDSLAGRIQIINLYPLSQCELENQPPHGFLNALFEDGFRIRRTERLGKNLGERIAAGGYPAALKLPVGRRQINWYRNYIGSQLQRDLSDYTRISTLDLLPKLLALSAAQTSGLFNLSSMASSLQVGRSTASNYLKLLEVSFLLERLPPWHSNLQSRLVKTPKIHIGDTGLACALLRANSDSLMADRSLLGQILETFVFNELRRQASCHDDFMSFYHYRDRDRAEVDIVIERGPRDVAGIEVKASGTVTKADFRGLRRLRDAVGSHRFKGGVVLYDGEISVGFGKGFYAVPLRMLWESRD